MKHTKKKFAGPAIVIGIVVLAALGGGLTWRTYVADRPSATRAELVDARTARAEFAPDQAPRIGPGAKAIISCQGARSTGIVARRDGGAGVFFLTLLQPFAGVPPGAPCEVTVDLSLPPEPASP
jgi:hypothetical protein